MSGQIPTNDIGQPPVIDTPYVDKFIPDKSKTVAVTGANGFLGTHIVEQLLKKGYQSIHCGGMGPNQHLMDLDHTGKLKWFDIDLLKDCFDEVFHDCQAVIHTASPVCFEPKDGWKDIVEPAITGIQNVLKSCLHHGVKKIVITSSTGAITDEPVKVYTESDWNHKSTCDRLPYWYSKAKSERIAWEFAQAHKELQVVVLNPTVFIGPYHSNSGVPESNKSLLQLVTADTKSEPVYILKLSTCVTDVRDVAKAHIMLLENPDVYGRYLCAEGSNHWQKDVIKKIVKNFPFLDSRVPRLPLPSAVFKHANAKDPDKAFVITHLDKLHHYDSSRIRNTLGMQFIDVEWTTMDVILDFIRKRHIKVSDSDYKKYVEVYEKRQKMEIPISKYVPKSSQSPSEEVDTESQPAESTEQSEETIPTPVPVPTPVVPPLPNLPQQPQPTSTKSTSVCLWCF